MPPTPAPSRRVGDVIESLDRMVAHLHTGGPLARRVVDSIPEMHAAMPNFASSWDPEENEAFQSVIRCRLEALPDCDPGAGLLRGILDTFSGG